MRTLIHLPGNVNESISRHVKRAVRRSLDAHQSGHEDEDTLTGQLGAYLRTPRPRRVIVDDDNIPGVWTWSLEYRKFRGRGPKATENKLGADGIFDFVVTHRGEQMRKASLFQAKTGSEDRQRLLGQCIKMSTWKEAAFVIQYSPDAYTALDFDNALNTAMGINAAQIIPLDAFIMDWFIACLVGDSDLEYVPEERALRWKDMTGERVEASFAVKHHFGLRVDAPPPGSSRYWKRVDPDVIHDHRMEASDEELLGLGRNPTAAELRRAKKEAAKRFHTDRHQQLEAEQLRILDLRMKETNAAAERVAIRLRLDKKPT
jgi:hypothetical protein